MGSVADITPSEFHERWSGELESGKVTLLDVREQWELDEASIAGTTAIPMGEIPTRLAELDAHRVTVVMCHGGVRSARVAEYLAGSGFEKVYNLVGGIDAWSQEIDQAVPRY